MGIKRSVPGRSLIVSVLSLLLVGVVGNVSAQTATITNTGPDSVNKIISANTDECTVTNNNNVGIYNTNTQNASTGNATVSHNTTVSGWGEWDPGVWAAKGYSYDQWYAAFSGYMASHAAEWKANWGSMLPSGGAVTGSASNVSSNSFAIGIKNGPACGGVMSTPNEPGRGGAPEAPAATPQARTEAEAARKAAGRGVGVGAGTNASAFVLGGTMQNGAGNPAQQPAGGQGGNNQPTPHDPGTYTPVVEQATISNTGPDSVNKIIYKNEETTTVTNNNNVNAVNVVTQTSTSGDAKVKDNTTAGGAGTGNGSNAAATGVGVTITN